MKLFSQDTKVQALKGAPLFESLSRKDLTQLARVSEDLEVEPGKVLCREGEIGHEFFVIVEGEIKVTRKGGASHLAAAATSSARSRSSTTCPARPRSPPRRPCASSC